MLDSVIKVNKKYYPQMVLKECKYEIKTIKWRMILMMILTLMMIMIMNLMNNLLINLRIKTVF